MKNTYKMSCHKADITSTQNENDCSGSESQFIESDGKLRSVGGVFPDVSMALALTFPFNIIMGIPLYSNIIKFMGV